MLKGRREKGLKKNGSSEPVSERGSTLKRCPKADDDGEKCLGTHPPRIGAGGILGNFQEKSNYARGGLTQERGKAQESTAP